MQFSSMVKRFSLVLFFVAAVFLMTSSSSVVFASDEAADTSVTITPTLVPCPHCEELDIKDSIVAPTQDEMPAQVAAVLFWTDGCPHCEEVLEALSAVEAEWGSQLLVETVELSGVDEIDYLYDLSAELGIPKKDVNFPLLLVGEDYLTGSQRFEARLSALVEKYLAQGGAELPFDLEAESLQLAETVQAKGKYETSVYFFWGEGCPHCAAAKPFLASLQAENPEIKIYDYEIYEVEQNREYFAMMAESYGFEPRAVPTIFIGPQYWVGFSEQIGQEIEATLNTCLQEGCEDVGLGLIREGQGAGQSPASQQENNPAESAEAAEPVEPAEEQDDIIKLPIIGEVDLSTQSLFVSTLLVSFVDGFNPCSIWVLSMLLALTLHSGSRRKIIIVGVVFLTVTALIYALFIAGLFTVFTFVSFVGWIQVVVALVALFFGLVNIKDYFWYKEGVSFTIADEKKPGIYKQIRRLMEVGDSYWGLISGTVVLAAGVSLVEFSCTAGFPVLWTNLLISQQATYVTFLLLLLVYMLVYQIDELGIFFVAVFSLKASKLEEKHGRILKLIGGMLMLTLAGVMLINPNLMNKLSSSLIVFGVAFCATLLLLLLHRLVLPRLGIHIGSEFDKKKKKRKRH